MAQRSDSQWNHSLESINVWGSFHGDEAKRFQDELSASVLVKQEFKTDDGTWEKTRGVTKSEDLASKGSWISIPNLKVA